MNGEQKNRTQHTPTRSSSRAEDGLRRMFFDGLPTMAALVTMIARRSGSVTGSSSRSPSPRIRCVTHYNFQTGSLSSWPSLCPVCSRCTK